MKNINNILNLSVINKLLMNLEMIVLIFLLIIRISFAIDSLDVMFKNTTFGELKVHTYELFETLRQQTGTAVDDVNLKLWCAVQCSEKNVCYFFTEIEDKCVLSVPTGTSADSMMQAYNASPLPNSAHIYYTNKMPLQKVYHIDKRYQETYDENAAGCRTLGMEMVSFTSVEDHQHMAQWLEAFAPAASISYHFWIDLTEQPDHTWIYGDGGADIPELWGVNEPNNNEPCAVMRLGYYEYKLMANFCEGGSIYRLCQRYLYGLF